MARVRLASQQVSNRLEFNWNVVKLIRGVHAARVKNKYQLYSRCAFASFHLSFFCSFSFKPFCDGSHKKLNLALKESQAKYEPLRFTCEESRSVLLCMCKAASNRPFCDQTHEELKIKLQQHHQIKASNQSN